MNLDQNIVNDNCYEALVSMQVFDVLSGLDDKVSGDSQVFIEEFSLHYTVCSKAA
ncbi:hypothetical protein [Acinetobacter stercoris]|uniref:Uncharacterized protein n=1 Tax=Acinetobacter stercoris TaxID=2126983 RepID=A0A2U3N1L5_9GAMM|nr:hypothetical protein [Acinetobacter stercoris]SPL71558.1 hypothetical protein KPC_2736 [Acinetobacter stercoris]